MAYNTFGPCSTLTDAERSHEARKILEMLREENEQDLERGLSERTREFVQRLWVEMDLGGGGVVVNEKQLWYLRDIWQKFQ